MTNMTPSFKINFMPKPLSKKISTSIRDDVWLLSRLDYIWSNYFGDVKQNNRVFIKFGRYSRFRLGSIRMEKTSKNSYIIISAMFRDLKIPIDIVDHTIAHELCHYTHGFSSPNPRLHKYPHHGGVIRKELQTRGLDNLVKSYAKWMKQYRDQLRT